MAHLLCVVVGGERVCIYYPRIIDTSGLCGGEAWQGVFS